MHSGLNFSQTAIGRLNCAPEVGYEAISRRRRPDAGPYSVMHDMLHGIHGACHRCGDLFNARRELQTAADAAATAAALRYMSLYVANNNNQSAEITRRMG